LADRVMQPSRDRTVGASQEGRTPAPCRDRRHHGQNNNRLVGIDAAGVAIDVPSPVLPIPLLARLNYRVTHLWQEVSGELLVFRLRIGGHGKMLIYIGGARRDRVIASIRSRDDIAVLATPSALIIVEDPLPTKGWLDRLPQKASALLRLHHAPENDKSIALKGLELGVIKSCAWVQRDLQILPPL